MTLVCLHHHFLEPLNLLVVTLLYLISLGQLQGLIEVTLERVFLFFVKVMVYPIVQLCIVVDFVLLVDFADAAFKSQTRLRLYEVSDLLWKGVVFLDFLQVAPGAIEWRQNHRLRFTVRKRLVV